MNESKRILITGGSGFIGTNVIEQLIAGGYSIINLDQYPPKIRSHEKFWEKVNLLDESEVNRLIINFLPSHVVHLAARTDLNGQNMDDYAVNTKGTENLMNALNQHSKPEHVLFASSMLVCRPGYIPTHDLDFSATTVYGKSKVRMEEIIRAADLKYRWNIIRPTSIWGPWFGTPYKDFFDRVLEKKMYTIGGRPSATKTYGFVLNASFQIEKLLLNSNIDRQVFYIGDNPALNINEWANVIAIKVYGKKLVAIPYFVFSIAGKVGDLLGYLGIPFPMTSFRLGNMTTDNILPLANLIKMTGEAPYNLSRAVDITLDWINNKN